MTSYEVTVPVTVTVEEEAGGLRLGGITLEGWGGFFSEAEDACGVWDVERGGWGCEAQEEIAEAARSFVRRLLRTGDTPAPVGHDAGGYDDEGRWWGPDNGPNHEHRSVGSHRSWCMRCAEWCYPDAPCVRCVAATPAVPTVAELTGAAKDDPTWNREDRTIWRVTAADLDGLAGRQLTESELDRIARAIDFSSARESISEVVFQVAHHVDDDSPGTENK